MSNLKLIFGLFLIFLGGIIGLFFRGYKGTMIPYPFLFSLSGIIITVLGFRLIRSASKAEDRQNDLNRKKWIKLLKAQAEVIQIDLSNCDIQTNHYIKEVEPRRSHWPDPAELSKRVQVHQTVLVYKHKNQDKIETFVSPILSYEPTTIRFKLAQHKTTNLYVDKEDRTHYYFDLEFLA